MTYSTTTLRSAPDLGAIKQKQRATWASGDYSLIGNTLQMVGDRLAKALEVHPGSRVLDVAAGNGNVSLALARLWCDVTSTDYVQSLLDDGRARAEAEGLELDFRIADAEQLPFEDGEFDGVVSTFGVMFAPDQQRAAAELLRVCRSRGRIGLANWTPDGFVGAMFRVLGRHVPPPPGLRSPADWGRRDWIEKRFRAATFELSFGLRTFEFAYDSPRHFVAFFRTYYGPVAKAFSALDVDGQRLLEADLLALIAEFNTASDGTMRVPGEYAEILMTKA
ncbi:MAG TPA: class I SAM-dependent methyltransferase [Planctomycetota bacterium]|nr:class I SAM-dependent methyltransferase [Planctomycetota bacterium]